MEQNLDQTVALLRCFPATLSALLRDLPNEWTLHDEGEGTWNAFDVVGHLVHLEKTDWMQRIRLVLQSSEIPTFSPVDRLAQMKESEGKTLQQLLAEFAHLRAENLGELASLNIGAADLERPGRHLSLGPVNLSQVLATWAAHDLTHLHQISRIMAYQYREFVGPWAKFLGVLHCSGHSSG